MNYTEEEQHEMNILASETMMKIYGKDTSGSLLYLFCKKLYAISKLKAFGIDDKYKFVVVTEDEYSKLKKLQEVENMKKSDPKIIFNFQMENPEFEEKVKIAMDEYTEHVIAKELDDKIQRIIENRIKKLVEAKNWSSDGRINNVSLEEFIRIKSEKVIEDILEKHIKEILAKKIAQVL